MFLTFFNFCLMNTSEQHEAAGVSFELDVILLVSTGFV